MPRVTNIEDIEQLEPDEPIMCVQGKLLEVFPRKTGENSTGPWSIQNAVLQDKTGKIDIWIKDRDELPKTWEGQGDHDPGPQGKTRAIGLLRP